MYYVKCLIKLCYVVMLCYVSSKLSFLFYNGHKWPQNTTCLITCKLCRATKCSIHNMLSRGAYCVPCIHNMLPLKLGAYCVGHASYLHNMLPS